MSTRPLHVLLVEDNDAEAALIAETLSRAPGVRATHERVARLQAGLNRLADGGIDLVLLDFSLPDSVGPQTFRRVRDAAPAVPVIILTNLADEEVASVAVRDGAQDYLVKRDVDEKLLGRAIRYAVERGRFEEALRESEERYALAARGANDGIWDWDVRTGAVYYSPRWHELLGCAPAEVGDSIDDWIERVHPSDRDGFRNALESHLLRGGAAFEHEHRLRRSDGEHIWVLVRGVTVSDAAGRTSRMAGSVTDVTGRKRVEEQLLHDAFHDGLTGLPNRALFLDRLAVALEHTRRIATERFAVLFIDLDRFKNINDSLGHSVGDTLLMEAAERLRRCLRPGDTVARLGGDEFAVFLPDVSRTADAVQVAERVLAALEPRYVLADHEVVTSASIGIALASSDYKHAEEVLRDADTAMYRAKAAGRGCIQVFDERMHESVAALLKMEMELRQAIDRQEFVMHYQPIVHLASSRIVGFEGLIRWRHAEKGLIPPQIFIAVAEETGLIVPIGWLALREACRQISEWQEQYPSDPPLYVSVNVSGKLFAQREMVEGVTEILNHTGLDPRSLRLEITESTLMDHADRAVDTLSALRGLGVQFSVDDFGTGYSSLSYLQRFSYDALKIDRSFIASLGTEGDGEVIVQAIVTLGTLLGMNVVAEGVETPDQLQRLRAMQCPQGQGFWFSRPVERAAAERLLTHGAPLSQ